MRLFDEREKCHFSRYVRGSVEWCENLMDRAFEVKSLAELNLDTDNPTTKN